MPRTGWGGRGAAGGGGRGEGHNSGGSWWAFPRETVAGRLGRTRGRTQGARLLREPLTLDRGPGRAGALAASATCRALALVVVVAVLPGPILLLSKLLYDLAVEPVMPAQGHQAGQPTLPRPACHRVGRHTEKLRNLRSGQILGFTHLDVGFLYSVLHDPRLLGRFRPDKWNRWFSWWALVSTLPNWLSCHNLPVQTVRRIGPSVRWAVDDQDPTQAVHQKPVTSLGGPILQDQSFARV